MSGQQAIIEKIIGSATLTAEDTLKQASARVDEIEIEAKAYAEKLKNAAEKERAEIFNSALSRRTSVATLEIKKIMLKVKREVLDRAYAEANESIRNLNKTQYCTLIAALIEAYAEDGDEVVLNDADKERISAEFIVECGKKKGVNLKAVYAKEPEGGIILRNSGCDKNLSVGALIEQVSREKEAQIAEVLFGGER